MPGKLLRISCGVWLMIASASPAAPSPLSSAPIAAALVASGSSRFAFRSAKMSAVAYGDDDQMMRTRGNVSVSKTSLACRSVSFPLGLN